VIGKKKQTPLNNIPCGGIMSLEESIAQDFVRFGEEAAKLSSLEFESITTCWERLGLGYLQFASRCPSHHAEVGKGAPVIVAIATQQFPLNNASCLPLQCPRNIGQTWPVRGADFT